MKCEVSEQINAPVADVWAAITDFERCGEWITSITNIEVLDRPDNGLVGFKWKETRVIFGKEATETMWITDVEEGRSYKTRAESHGSIYVSWLSIEGDDGNVTLRMGFDGQPQSLGAKLMTVAMGWMMKGAMAKEMGKDLREIKAHVEKQASGR